MLGERNARLTSGKHEAARAVRIRQVYDVTEAGAVRIYEWRL